MKNNTLLKLATVAAILSAAFVGCSDKKYDKVTTTSTTHSQTKTDRQKMLSLPSGAGVLCQNNQVILIPLGNEDRPKYEKRLADINAYSQSAGYKFISIIDSENKAIYDAAMMEIYPKMHGRLYNMVYDPVSSWVSMQIGGGEIVSKYTPDDIVRAQKEFAQKHNSHTL